MMRFRVLDAFCGMGGLSLGFRQAGFQVCGVDMNEQCGEVYLYNKVGRFIKGDLTRFTPKGRWDVVVGGPPCEPWSALNLTRRGVAHPKAKCVDAFFRVVRAARPRIFVLENVVGLRVHLPRYIRRVERWYGVSYRVIEYSDYGAATSRRRLFCLGVRRGLATPEELFEAIRRGAPKSVRDAIWDLRGRAQDAKINHVWFVPKTVQRYIRYYREGKFGWYVLRWDSPAPSFGNVTKTYILHPDSFNGGSVRPISVREAMRIMGFPDTYRFPPRLGLHPMYEMVSDSVSPVFSKALAEAVREYL
jgi:DNA (cytosine-5)-methyltransferase 1